MGYYHLDNSLSILLLQNFYSVYLVSINTTSMLKKTFLSLIVILPIAFFAQLSGTYNANFRIQHFIENQSDTVDFVGVFVKGNNQDAIQFSEQNQGIYRGEVKGWQYIRIPGHAMADLIQDKRFSSVDYAPYQGTPMSDTMRVNNRIDSVHYGTAPLSTGYTGENVVLGFIDTGIDFAHPDFKDTAGKTRILHIWDQTKGTNANTPSQYGYGQHWDSAQINAGNCTNQDQWGHGSTVSGAASSNGLANGTHKGVAPNSQIIAVESKFNATDWLATVVDATEYIFNYADTHNLSCAINASVGTYLGSHDGLDPYALYIDSLILAKRGRLYVASAGNSGDWEKYHLHTDVTPDTAFTWFENNPSSAFGGDAAFWELWTDTADFNQVEYAIGADKTIPNFEFRGRTTFKNVINNLNVLLYDTIRNGNNDIIATVQTWAEQRDGQYLVQVYMPSPDSSDYLFRFETVGIGSYDAWSIEDYGMSRIVDTIPSVAAYTEMSKYIQPDSLQSIVSSFQCSPNVLTVGNYANDSGYVSKYGTWIPNNFERGKLFSSSSKGPSRLGLIKPEITATGHGVCGPAPIFRINQWVAANVDSTLAYGGMHMVNGGTSMASPVVAGVGALLLEKCPSLNQEEYMSHIASSAYTDNFTGTNLPNNAFGYGKLDGFAAVISSSFLPNYNGSTSFCFEDSTSIVLLSDYESVLWENGSTDYSQVFSNSDTTFVFAIDSSGCLSDTLHVELTEREKPLVDQFFAPFFHCDGDSSEILLTGFNLADATWEDGFIGLNHFVQGTHNYYVIGEDIEGCFSDTSWVSIIENPLPPVPLIYYIYDSLVATSGYANYNWELNNNQLASTGLDSVLIVSQNGDYTVRVTDINGCQNISIPFSYSSTDIQNNLSGSINIFPNPTDGLININGLEGIINIEIIDVTGKAILKSKSQSNTSKIDISDLPNGIYFVRLESAENRFVQKIVLNK
jgi:subtilisin family serine protease